MWENIGTKHILLYDDQFYCKKCSPDNCYKFINTRQELGWKSIHDIKNTESEKKYKCTECKEDIRSPIHESGDKIPPLRCSKCNPSTNFTKYNWDGRTWKIIFCPDDLDTEYIKSYLIKCGIQCKSYSKDKIISIIKDLDKDIYNIHKYINNKDNILKKYKVNSDDDYNGFIIRIY
jgi:DNA-directed RNA polymerase subunit RPC12/RpoP